MSRSFLIAILLVLSGVSQAAAQAWATKMFGKTTRHDFGTVAKGAKTEFRFEFENIYEEDVHVADVRTSCGCTTPSIEKKSLKTWEKSAIIAVFNTRTFEGLRSATITVVIDKPFYAEVQLRVEGNIRGDVVFEPGQVDLGEVDVGSSRQKTIRVSLHGRSDWKITDVRSGNPNFEVELSEPQRTAGRVTYDMLVRLKPGAPEGYLNDQLTILTDQQKLALTVPVIGRIVPPVQVSPALLTMGTVAPGQKVTRQLVVQGKSPFKVTRVTCPDGCFEFEVTDQAKKLHLIPVTFTAGDAPSKIEQKIQIETDLGDGAKACCIATAVVAADKSAVNPQKN